MSKFKVGDWVIVNNIANTSNFKSHYLGEVGKIVYISGYDILLQFNNSKLNSVIWEGDSINPYPIENFPNYFVSESEIKLAKIRNTKLSRKIYPNYRVDGKWLIRSKK